MDTSAPTRGRGGGRMALGKASTRMHSMAPLGTRLHRGGLHFWGSPEAHVLWAYLMLLWSSCVPPLFFLHWFWPQTSYSMRPHCLRQSHRFGLLPLATGWLAYSADRAPRRCQRPTGGTVGVIKQPPWPPPCLLQPLRGWFCEAGKCLWVQFCEATWIIVTQGMFSSEHNHFKKYIFPVHQSVLAILRCKQPYVKFNNVMYTVLIMDNSNIWLSTITNIIISGSLLFYLPISQWGSGDIEKEVIKPSKLVYQLTPNSIYLSFTRVISTILTMDKYVYDWL